MMDDDQFIDSGQNEAEKFQLKPQSFNKKTSDGSKKAPIAVLKIFSKTWRHGGTNHFVVYGAYNVFD